MSRGGGLARRSAHIFPLVSTIGQKGHQGGDREQHCFGLCVEHLHLMPVTHAQDIPPGPEHQRISRRHVYAQAPVVHHVFTWLRSQSVGRLRWHVGEGVVLCCAVFISSRLALTGVAQWASSRLLTGPGRHEKEEDYENRRCPKS